MKIFSESLLDGEDKVFNRFKEDADYKKLKKIINQSQSTDGDYLGRKLVEGDVVLFQPMPDEYDISIIEKIIFKKDIMWLNLEGHRSLIASYETIKIPKDSIQDLIKILTKK